LWLSFNCFFLFNFFLYKAYPILLFTFQLSILSFNKQFFFKLKQLFYLLSNNFVTFNCFIHLIFLLNISLIKKIIYKINKKIFIIKFINLFIFNFKIKKSEHIHTCIFTSIYKGYFYSKFYPLTNNDLFKVKTTNIK